MDGWIDSEKLEIFLFWCNAVFRCGEYLLAVSVEMHSVVIIIAKEISVFESIYFCWIVYNFY